tara:strand:+ start:19 stop:522 length:504 start_codon:yes stop_codon:yes gene_type:complete
MKKYFILIFIFLLACGNSDEEGSVDEDSAIIISESSTQCEVWVAETQENAQTMIKLLDDLYDYSEQYDDGLLSEVIYIEALGVYYERTQEMLLTQASSAVSLLTLDEINDQPSVNFFENAIEFTLMSFDGLYLANINDDSSYFEEGANWILKAKDEFNKTISYLNNC